MSIFEHAARLEQDNQAFALASIIETRGSAPRHQGKMIVKADGNIIGTVGGGMIERYIIDQAIEAIKAGESRTVTGRMARTGHNAMDMDCGGAMTVFIEVIGNKPALVLIGAGHVNRALAQAAHVLGFAITVADCYSESLKEQHFPNGTQRILGATMEQAIEQLTITPESFVVIATNHQDQDAISKLVDCDCRYIGLMASRRKVQVLFSHLRTLGVSEQRIRQIHSPVGFNIGAETPEEIAISILAEILTVKHQASGAQLKQEVAGMGHKRVLIRGAGDMASGVAVRLHRAGFEVIMTDIPLPTHIRRTVAFAQCLYDGEMTLEGITARRADSLDCINDILKQGAIPVLADPDCELLPQLAPRYLVDAILAKRNLGTHMAMAPFTIGLGPGFNAGKDCHCVVETNRGHQLGRLVYQGESSANTGIPGDICGYTHERVMRAPHAGTFHAAVALGDIVNEGDVVAYIDETPVTAPLSGMVRGLLNSELPVGTGFKIGDIDPRGELADCTTVSDKARAIGGSVLEALLHFDA